jgi:Fe-S-cluster-containing hydrogenase component 2
MLPACPVGAIAQDGYGLPRIDPERCVECGKCMKICGMKTVYKSDDHGKTV